MRIILMFGIAMMAGLASSPTVLAGLVVNAYLVIAGTFEPGRGEFSDDFWADEDGDHLSVTSEVNYSHVANKSINIFQFDEAGNSALARFDWRFFIDGEVEGEAYAVAGFRFTVDIDTRWEVTGIFSEMGNAAMYQGIEFYQESEPYLELYEYSAKESRTTADEIFTVGQNGEGDTLDEGTNNFSGVLLAGHTYTLYSVFYIHAYDEIDPTTATGNLTLKLDAIQAQAVPAPSSWILFTLATAFTILYQRYSLAAGRSLKVLVG